MRYSLTIFTSCYVRWISHSSFSSGLSSYRFSSSDLVVGTGHLSRKIKLFGIIIYSWAMIIEILWENWLIVFDGELWIKLNWTHSIHIRLMHSFFMETHEPKKKTTKKRRNTYVTLYDNVQRNKSGHWRENKNRNKLEKNGEENDEKKKIETFRRTGVARVGKMLFSFRLINSSIHRSS